MIEKVTYESLKDCYRISNKLIELIIPTDRGPGILHFGFVGQPNEFTTIPDWGFTTHRLWAAPEAHPRSYVPDTVPMVVKQDETSLRLIKPTEKETGIEKEIIIPISPEKNHITITHRLYNRGLWPVELAPWAISAMAAGGKAILPLPRRQPSTLKNLLPTTMMAIWEYSDLADPRMKIGTQYIIVGQDVNAAASVKIGIMDTDGWGAYWNKGRLFIKTFEYIKGANYPDFGSSVEVYSGKGNLELETLAPLRLLQPGESAELVENWFLFKNVAEPKNDSDVEKHVLPLVKGQNFITYS
jgi:hypothetical protein